MEHGVDIGAFLIAFASALFGAKLFGGLAERVGQPSVLGELLAGVVIGNLGLAGYHGLEGLRVHPGLDLLAQIGVLFLLFKVGVETDIGRWACV